MNQINKVQVFLVKWSLASFISFSKKGDVDRKNSIKRTIFTRKLPTCTLSAIRFILIGH